MLSDACLFHCALHEVPALVSEYFMLPTTSYHLFVCHLLDCVSIEKNGNRDDSWANSCGKKLAVFSHLLFLILQQAVKVGNHSCKLQQLRFFWESLVQKSVWMSLSLQYHKTWVGLSHNSCKSCTDSSSYHHIYSCLFYLLLTSSFDIEVISWFFSSSLDLVWSLFWKLIWTYHLPCCVQINWGMTGFK